MFENGQTRHAIADNLGVHYGTVCNWIRRYAQAGETGIELEKRSRRSGEDRKLTQTQEAKLQKIIGDKSSLKIKLPFALWASGVIQELPCNLWHVLIVGKPSARILNAGALLHKSQPNAL